MKDTITVTSKGQTTLPVELRNQLGLGKEGGVLQVKFDTSKRQLIISKPMTLDDLSKLASSYIKPGTKPLTNVDEYYQAHRKIT